MNQLLETPVELPAEERNDQPSLVRFAELQSLLGRYPASGPRYTSYPTAADFSTDFSASDLDRSIAFSNVQNRRSEAARDLSVYLHLPFCEHLCFYCGCNKVLTRNRGKGVDYLGHLFREMELWRARLEGERTVRQLHLGGGTPTFFDVTQIRQVTERLGQCFNLVPANPDRDYSIEIDPRTVDAAYVAELVEVGFNRMSIGVQDFDPDVQEAVHRLQDADHVARLVESARACGVGSLNLDLIYGLPRQSVDSFRRTLARVVECSPDRLSIYQYAHLPERFPAQQRIVEAELPDVETRLALQQLTTDTLAEAGYVHIGMDHFARPEDPLVSAMGDGTLKRSFQGYTTHGDCELLGMGVSSIGEIGDCLYQNSKQLDAYYESVDAGRLAVERGIRMDTDDHVRKSVIMDIMCHGEVDRGAFRETHGIGFDEYFPEVGEGLAGASSPASRRSDSRRGSVGHSAIQLAAASLIFLLEMAPRGGRVSQGGGSCQSSLSILARLEVRGRSTRVIHLGAS